ncbi:hypothetical protein [Neisseria lactamica]|uniref:hypothetical protein n=1 Tax=Neisseria lactamica TaxID=486 RepID=UPI000BB65D5B|nr:hypothetical protein [Neisseria lactamica]
MDILSINNQNSTISLTQDEVFVLRATLSEIYAGVCVDAREFEIIHGVEKDEVDDLEKYFIEIYEKMTTCQPTPEPLV